MSTELSSIAGISTGRVTEELTKITPALTQLVQDLSGMADLKPDNPFFKSCETLTLINRRLTGLVKEITRTQGDATDLALAKAAFVSGITMISDELKVVARALNTGEPSRNQIALYSIAQQLNALVDEAGQPVALPALNTIAPITSKDGIKKRLDELRTKQPKWIVKNQKLTSTESKDCGLKGDDASKFLLLFHSFGTTKATFTKINADGVFGGSTIANQRGIPNTFWAKLETNGLIERSSTSKPRLTVYQFTTKAEEVFLKAFPLVS